MFGASAALLNGAFPERVEHSERLDVVYANLIKIGFRDDAFSIAVNKTRVHCNRKRAVLSLLLVIK
jgi:hypothetical protein